MTGDTQERGPPSWECGATIRLGAGRERLGLLPLCVATQKGETHAVHHHRNTTVVVGPRIRNERGRQCHPRAARDCSRGISRQPHHWSSRSLTAPAGFSLVIHRGRVKMRHAPSRMTCSTTSGLSVVLKHVSGSTFFAQAVHIASMDAGSTSRIFGQLAAQFGQPIRPSSPRAAWECSRPKTIRIKSPFPRREGRRRLRGGYIHDRQPTPTLRLSLPKPYSPPGRALQLAMQERSQQRRERFVYACLNG